VTSVVVQRISAVAREDPKFRSMLEELAESRGGIYRRALDELKPQEADELETATVS
jgi:hypothetical protein